MFVNQAHAALFGLPRQEALGRTMAETHGEDYALPAACQREGARDRRPLARPRYETVGSAAAALPRHRQGPLKVGLGQQVLNVASTSPSCGGGADSARSASPTASPACRRHIFRDRVDQELRARAGARDLALLHVDLDRFKGINDAFGKEFGNGLLQAVARRLRGRLRDTDVLARLHSDEFIVLQTGIKRPDDAAELAGGWPTPSPRRSSSAARRCISAPASASRSPRRRPHRDRC